MDNTNKIIEAVGALNKDGVLATAKAVAKYSGVPEYRAQKILRELVARGELSRVSDRIVEAVGILNENKKLATCKAIQRATGISYNSVQKVTDNLVDSGKLVKIGRRAGYRLPDDPHPRELIIKTVQMLNRQKIIATGWTVQVWSDTGYSESFIRKELRRLKEAGYLMHVAPRGGYAVA